MKSKGETVSRPSYGGTTITKTSSAGSDKISENDNEDALAGEDGPVDLQQDSNELERFKYTRKNHEATSDEEE